MASFTITRNLLDIGLFSDNPAMLEFYEHELGLPLHDVLQHSPTYQERFYSVNGASLKINYSTAPMAPGTSGYRGLLIARDDVEQAITRHDPDGLAVTLVPTGERGVTHLGVVAAVPDVAHQRRFLTDALGAAEDRDGLTIGDTRILLTEAPRTAGSTPTWRRGFNYILVAVDDSVAAHHALLAAGATHGMRPIRLADRCIFSGLLVPSGNWVELAQYAEDTGALPDIARAADLWPEITAWRDHGTPY
jgi:catechol 2,3-dioxygenase-like lactoylglutathione lyase family enzyme